MNHAQTRPMTANHIYFKWLLWSILGLMTLSVLIFDEVPLLDSANSEHLRLWNERALLFPHAVLGTIALLIGPLQFSSRIRERNFRRHRLLGKIYVTAVLIAAAMGALLGHRIGGLFGFAVYVQASLWTITTVAAFVTARNRQIAVHRQWMMRSYAVTFIFVSSRVLDVVPLYKNMSMDTGACVVLFINLLSIVIPDLAQSWRAFRTKAA